MTTRRGSREHRLAPALILLAIVAAGRAPAAWAQQPATTSGLEAELDATGLEAELDEMAVPDPIDTCLRATPGASVQRVSFRIVDRLGNERELVGQLSWRRGDDNLSQSLLRIEAPEDVAGSSYLIRERDGGVETFVRLPAYNRVRRVKASDLSTSLFGTDWSYEDLRHVRHLAAYADRIRKPDAEIDGRAVWHLEILPPMGEESAYDVLLAWLDPKTCVALRIDFVGRDGKVVKRFEVDPKSIGQVGPLWLAHSMALRDLENSTTTHLDVSDVQVPESLPDHLFSLDALAGNEPH